MFNTTIKFSKLISGILSIVWLTLLFLVVRENSFQDLLDLLIKYKDLSALFLFLIIVLSYPIGIVISHCSYHFATLTLYPLFLRKKLGFDLKAHNVRTKKLSTVSTDLNKDKMIEKTEELSILGTCGINFFSMAIILSLYAKLTVLTVYSFLFSIVFFIIVIEKYKLWYKVVENQFNTVFQEETNPNSE